MTKKWLILVMVLMLAGLLVSGCAENQSDDTTDAQLEENDDQQAESQPGEVGVVPGETKENPVRMEYYGFVPAETEISEGDIIIWRNYNKQKVYTLISDDGLFEDQEMKFGNMFNYTFTESGTYTFSVEDAPNMTLTVKVV